MLYYFNEKNSLKQNKSLDKEKTSIQNKNV